MTETAQQQDPDFDRYPETILHFAGPGAVTVDLRRAVAVDDIERLRRRGLKTSFAVLTAHDPEGRDLDESENARRSEALKNRIASAHLPFVEVDACSPDGNHCECSVAIDTPLAAAIELASAFDQVAIFWFDGARFWIESVIRTIPPIPLPR